MNDEFNRRACCWIVIPATLLGLLCTCSSQVGLRPSDINSLQDSIIVGRIRFLPGTSCASSFQLPIFELRNVGERKATSFSPPGWIKPQAGHSIDIPIYRKTAPGTYDLRIEVEKGHFDSVWLDENLLTLLRFEVPKGLLVYFGTIEVGIECEGSRRQSVAQYVHHTIQDESKSEINLFKDDFPQIYRMYENKILIEVSKIPWKEL